MYLVFPVFTAAPISLIIIIIMIIIKITSKSLGVGRRTILD